MHLRDLDCWPPTLIDSNTFRVVVPKKNPLPARLKRAAVLSIAGSPQPYLSIVVDYQGRDWHASIQDVPESLMRRIAATLRGHEGETLASLADLELIEDP